MQHTIRHDNGKRGITFGANDVTPATEALSPIDYAEALRLTLLQSGGAIEAYSRDTKPLVYPFPLEPDDSAAHAFVIAANLAYDRHYPLTLSPDMIWLLIAQGFALHVHANAETLRSRLVSHEGNRMLYIRRDTFIRGFAGNDWEGAIAEFSEQIQAHVGADTHTRVVREFSTTGIVEKAAMAITLMDALQHYYSYKAMSLCGIPAFTLEGTPEDWDTIRAGAAALADYDLDWWLDPLLPVLDQFAAASRGNVDSAFWQNFFKDNFGSGGPYINGHIVNLFPYQERPRSPLSEIPAIVRQYQRLGGLSQEEAEAWAQRTNIDRGTPSRNPHLGWVPETGRPRPMEGMTTNTFSSALSSAPFTWEYRGTELSMEFVAGFVGVSQDAETLALRPEIGWAVREKNV